MVPFGRASPAEERHRVRIAGCPPQQLWGSARRSRSGAAPAALCGAAKVLCESCAASSRFTPRTGPCKALREALHSLVGDKNGTTRRCPGGLHNYTMRGEASDFAAMRDAFRSAGLCTEATPARSWRAGGARRDDASDGEDSLYVPSPQRVKIRRRLAEACRREPRFVAAAAERPRSAPQPAARGPGARGGGRARARGAAARAAGRRVRAARVGRVATSRGGGAAPRCRGRPAGRLR